MRKFFAKNFCGVSKNLNPGRRKKNIHKSVQFSGRPADKVRTFFINPRNFAAYLLLVPTWLDEVPQPAAKMPLFVNIFNTLHPEVSVTSGKGQIERRQETS